ncbi:amidohydrolase family protein [Myxococcota bacterium]|nr:amidohydrolase family protein [Myxococcota bacterium]
MPTPNTKSLLIRGGTVVDGTAAPRFRADVRVTGDRITEIRGEIEPLPGERVFDASGCFVTPGFIECHTHFDGTMWWQSDLDPLPGNGVTSCVMGNCGFSAAPISRDLAARDEMIKIFSFFEDIPLGPFLSELPWNWETWSEYRASIEQSVEVPIHYGAFVGHIALRLAVMGLEAWDRAARPDEIARMAELLEDGLKAGAMGLSSNLMDHDGEDRPVPSLLAEDDEFVALIDVLARHPGTVLQVIVDTFRHLNAPESTQRLADLCEGKPVRVQWGGLPSLEFQKRIQTPLAEMHERFKQDGRDFWTAYAHVAPTVNISIYHSLLFAQSNDYVWHEVVLAEKDEDKLALLRDPDWRARARHSWDHETFPFSTLRKARHLKLFHSDNGVGPVGITLGEYAEQLDLPLSDAMAEWLIRNGLGSTLLAPSMKKDDAMVERLLKDSHSVGPVSDAGAHGQMLCGGGENLLLFTDFVKKRGVLSVEEAVHIQTGKLAEHFALHDRGRIEVGWRADVTVFDLDEIEFHAMEKITDVPDGNGGKTWRWTRPPAPVRLTLVDGVPTFENGTSTGARPGALMSPSVATV